MSHARFPVTVLLALVTGATWSSEAPNEPLPACCNVNHCPTGDCPPPVCDLPEPTTVVMFSQAAKNLRYRHWAVDYCAASAPQGCTTGCGGAAPAALPGGATLPGLRLERVLYHDTHLPSSLGQNWSFTCDVWLDCYQPGQVASGRPTGVPGWQILVAKPQRSPIDFYVGVDGDGDGIYQDQRQAYFRGLRFLDAGGVQVPNPVGAASAVFNEWDGGSWTFEMYEEAPGKYLGRPVRYQDRNGNAIVHTWKYAITDPAMTGSLRLKLRIRDRITDAAGRSAVFTYDESALVGGAYVATAVALPNGSTIGYTYATHTNPGRGTYGGLAGVTHPDGSTSTFASALDAARNCVRYDIHDPAADPESRHVTAWFSTSAWIDPANPKRVVSQIFGRVRLAQSGAGDTVFSGTIVRVELGGGAHEDRTFFWNQGKLTAVVHHDGGAPEAIYVRDALDDGNPVFSNLDGPRGGWNQWAGWTQKYSMVPGPALLAAASWTDALGRTTSRDLDPATDRPRSVTHPDGTRDEAEYNTYLAPTRQVDRLGRVTTFLYDTAGNLLERTAAVGLPEQATERWSYWSATDSDLDRGRPGQVRSHTDANGNVTDYRYTAAGDLAQVIGPADVPGGTRPVTGFTYDGAGRLVATTDPAGRVTRFAWDARNRQVGTTYADGSTETVTYGVGVDANLPVARSDRNGVVTTIAYDGAGRPTATTRAAGRPEAVTSTTAWQPAHKGLPIARTEAGATTTFRYDARLRLVEERRRASAGAPDLVTTHGYDAQDRRIATTDPFGRRTLVVYDVNDHVVRTIRELVPGGVPTGADLAALARDATPNPAYIIEEAVVDAAGQMLAQVDGRGIRTEHAYDGRGRPVQRTEAAGTPDAATTTTVYDAVGNRIRSTGARGQVTLMAYTGRNLLAQVTEAAGAPEAASTTYTYSPTGKVATVTDALGRTTVNIYGTCCDRVEQVVDPLGFVTRFSYDPVGNRVAVVDANGLATTTAFDGLRRPVAVSNAAGEVMRTQYDDHLADGAGLELVYPAAIAGLGFGPGGAGRAQAVTDPVGAVRLTVWDALGRVVRTVDALGHATSTAHDAVVDGLVETTVTDALGATTHARADAAGRIRLAIDALGQRSTAAFDASGNRVAWRDANGVGQDCTFDVRNREVLCAETNGSAKRTAYDADGNRVIEVDALGAPTNHVYDLRGRRLSTRDRIGAVTGFAYDAVGNLLAITDAEGKVTRYAYDARNLLVREQFPDGQATPGGRDVRTYTYDPARRLATRIDQAGVVTTYRYDAANRLTSRQYSGGTPSDSFAYDPAGRLITAAAGASGVDVTRTYDAAGRLTREQQRIDGLEFPVGYTYDARNQVTGLTYPDGTAVTRSYTQRGELNQVTMDGQPVATHGYDAGGRLTTTASANGVVETRAYPLGDQQVAQITARHSATGAAVVTDFRYAYDANRRKTVERDEALAPAEQRFGYDAQDRLTAWDRTGAASATQRWALTPVGDWASTTRDGDTERRTHTDVHEIATIDRQRLRHDAKGNLLEAPGLPSLSWDVENRLARAQGLGPNGPVQASYRYDALGRRVQKVVNGKATTYLSAGAQTVVEVTGRLLNAPWLNPVPALVEDGLLDAQGSVLQATGGYRLNFQPPRSDTPDGWLADEGAVYGKRGDGLFYGWTRPAWFAAERHQLDQPQWDTFVGMDFLGLFPSEWSMQLPNGTYPVIIVMGDAASRAQTNTITVNGRQMTDPTPWDGTFTTAAYEEGSFDGYALDVVVTDGRLRLKPVKNQSRNPKLCFIEIGPAGSAITQAQRDRLDAVVQGMTKATAQNHGRTPTVTRFAYGSYVDAVLAFETVERGRTTRRYVHANHLYSPAAVTDVAGVVQERYRYSAYGEQSILTADGRARGRSKVGLGRSYTGHVVDAETGLLYARSRMYSAEQGRFVSRDSIRRDDAPGPVAAEGYHDGMSLYRGYFVPLGLDPTGEGEISLDQLSHMSQDAMERLAKQDPKGMQEAYEKARRQDPALAQKIKQAQKFAGTRWNHTKKGIVSAAAAKVVSTAGLVCCELACATMYNACLQRAVDTANEGFETANGIKNPQLADDYVSNVESIAFLDMAECATKYAICGLSCMLPFTSQYTF